MDEKVRLAIVEGLKDRLNIALQTCFLIHLRKQLNPKTIFI